MRRTIMIICLVLSMVWISACTAGVGEGESGSAVLPSQLPKNVVFKNGTIYTSNEKQDIVEAVAVKEGKIIFVGSNKDVEEFINEDTKVVDLQGRFILPGFVDNHNHIFEAKSPAAGNCSVSPDASLQKQRSYLKACKKGVKDGEWISGTGFSLEALLKDMDEKSEQQTPLQVLDELFPNNPVLIMERTSHSVWVNSKALELAGINKDTKDPQGGRIIRDSETGEPFGILYDTAGDIVMEKAWNSQPNLFEKNYEGLLDGLDEVAKNGITTVGDGRLYWKRGWLDVWNKVNDEKKLTSRVVLRPWVYPNLNEAEQMEYFKKIKRDDVSSRMLINQVKMYSDGISINSTAKTLEKYKFEWFTGTPYGLNYIPEEKMKWWLTELNKIGYGALIHTIGDAGVRESLNAIEAAKKEGANQPYTLTHVEMVEDSDIDRFAKLGISADFQVGHDFAEDPKQSWASTYFTNQQMKRIMPLGRIWKTGANVSLSSDWDVNELNPLVTISNALSIDEKGLSDVYAAIDAYTIKPAKALGLDNITGSIEVGKSADMVLLNEDITKMSADKIPNAKVLVTVLQGEVVYHKEK
ncbi:MULTISPECIES: amidohydrolase [Bacillus]|jgi:predicted amidohydrolase YtcJ|uniref:Amidohydrolase n=4 Tax=Bacillus cereus group TaxID=86661 RepID=A0A9X6ZYK0_BACCE|nr:MULTISPECIES: amidohydrolase [Bacillus]MBJ6720800.1 amidohydrolase [Bacillus sp. PR5]MDV8113206.1 amidohydrolase [Bacillus sp. BAU-SS-2023]CGF88100.1 N-substituted formamide deformylase precursor [Streptococcus pneumoniae]AQQ64134.1 N-substituted formamide deformylase [Bacillus cereus]EEL75515.1 Amidohydrolase 3 [Bacillus cereus AH676]